MSFSQKEITGIFVSGSLAMFLSVIDIGVVPTALSTIGKELNAGSQLSWVITAFMMAITVSTPIYGKLLDIYGYQLMLKIAVSIFIVGAILCSTANNITLLISYRIIQGCGSGGLMLLAFVIVGRVIPPDRQGLYQGFLGGIFALACLIGPLLGGWFSEFLSWRLIFLLYVPIGVLVLFKIQSSMKRLAKGDNANAKIDLTGALLFTVWIVALLLLINQFTSASKDVLISTPLFLVLVVVLLLLFIIQEKRASEPIIPLRLFGKPGFSVIVATTAIYAISAYAATLYIPNYFQLVIGATATQSALMLEAVQVGMVIGPVASGWLVGRYLQHKTCLLLIIGITVVMYVLISLPYELLKIHITAIPILMMMGVGLGTIMPLMTLITQNSADKSDLGSATAVLGLFRTMGTVIGSTVFSAIYSTELISKLSSLQLSSSQMSNIQSQGVKAIADLSESIQLQVLQACSGSSRSIFLAAAVCALIAWVIALFIKRLSLKAV